jgi:hypothetical protein
MRVILLSVILALVPLAFVAYIVLFGSILTVDGLFMSLILLTISGIFLLNVLLELKAHRQPKPAAAKTATAPARGTTAAAPTMATSPTAGEVRREAGTVVQVDYYEAPVGQPNKSVVTFQPNGSATAQVIVLQGDVRHVLPPGKRVKISYEAAPEGNRLVSVE